MSELDNNFLNVRKAYRLLHDYQRRVIDLAFFIGKKHYGLNVVDGNPWFSDGRGLRTSITDKKWAWDWLEMYYFDFYFEGECNNQKVQLGVIIQSDTGCFDKNDASRTDIQSFAPVEESETRLILAISNGKWDSSPLRGKKGFSKSEKEYPADGTGLNDENVKIIAKAFSLSDFKDEVSVKKKLKEFETFCFSKGLDLNKTN